MIFNVPKDFNGPILDGDRVSYPIIAGQVTIPDEKVPSNIWGFGFTVVEPETKVEPKQSVAYKSEGE